MSQFSQVSTPGLENPRPVSNEVAAAESAAQAEAAKLAAQAAQTAAGTHAANAGLSASAALTAKAGAEAARDDAQAAKTAAQGSASTAGTKATEAGASAVAAQGSATSAATSATAANTSRIQAVAAQGNAAASEHASRVYAETALSAASIAAAQIIDQVEAHIGEKADLNSPAFTGVPTAPTAAAGTSSTQLATTAFVGNAMDALLNGAPGALNTLFELAAAIGNDPNFAATVAASIGGKLAKTANLSDVTDPASARANIGLAIGSDVQAYSAQLANLAALSASGFVARIAGNTFAARTLTGTTGQISIANGDGISGNPTISLPSALTGINSVTAAAGQNLVLTGGSSGASLTLGQGASGIGVLATSVSDGGLRIASSSGGGYLTIGNPGSSADSKWNYIGAGSRTLVFGRVNDDLSTRTEYARFAPSGNLLIGGTTDISGSGGLKIFGATAANNTTSGALQVAGGVGIGGAIWAGGGVRGANEVQAYDNAATPTVRAYSSATYDAVFSAYLAGVREWAFGAKRSDGTFRFSSQGGVLGTNDVLTLSHGGAATLAGNLTVNGGLLTLSGGAGTKAIQFYNASTGGGAKLLVSDDTNTIDGLTILKSGSAANVTIPNGNLTVSGTGGITLSGTASLTPTQLTFNNGGVAIIDAGNAALRLKRAGGTANAALVLTDSTGTDAVRFVATGTNAGAITGGNGTPTYQSWDTSGNSAILGTLTVNGTGTSSFAGAITAGTSITSFYASALNDTATNGLQAWIGTDATLGPVRVSLGAVPSATGGSRYGYIGVGDNSAMRPLYLNTNGTVHGTVYVPSTSTAFNTTSGALVVGSNVGLSGNAGGTSYFGGAINQTMAHSAGTEQYYRVSSTFSGQAYGAEFGYGLTPTIGAPEVRINRIYAGVVSRAATVDASSGDWTFTGKIIAPASTTSAASLNLPHGTAPTSPANGDIWTTTSGVFARINGATTQLNGGGGGIDRTTTLDEFDDFMMGGAITNTTGRWFGTMSGSGATAQQAGAVDAVHPGVYSLETGTTTTGRSNISAFIGATAGSLLFGGGTLTFETLVYIPTLSTGTDEYSIALGFGDLRTGTASADGAYFLYDRATTGTNWRAVTASNSTRTTTDTSTAVAATTWTKLKVIVNAAGTSAAFYINGSLVATNTTNIPTASGNEFGVMLGIYKSAGTLNRTFLSDYVWVNQALSAAR